MRKILTFSILILALAGNAWAAISANCWWNHRPAGSNFNGGGFVQGASGTDYSRQDHYQYELSGSTTSGASAVILDVSAAADMVGNIIAINGGTNFIPGYYEIKSVVAGVSITVDRNCTTDSGSDLWAYIGGAWQTPVAATWGAAVNGNRIWIQEGSYDPATLPDDIDISAKDNITIEGYDNTYGDTPTGNNRPLIESQGKYLTFGQGTTIRNIRFTITDAELTFTGASSMENCKVWIKGTARYAIGASGIVGMSIRASEICASDTAVDPPNGLVFTGDGSQVIDCFVHDISGIAVRAQVVVNTIITNATTAIVSSGLSSSRLYLNNTIVGCTAGIDLGTGGPTAVQNNIIVNCVTGVSPDDATISIKNNNFYGCTTSIDAAAYTLNNTFLDPQFTDAANYDFRIGTNLKAKGFPGSFANMGASANCVSYTDPGAVQRIEPTGGGGETSHTFIH